MRFGQTVHPIGCACDFCKAGFTNMSMKERWDAEAEEIKSCESLPELVIKFFDILDAKESNDEGTRTFNPVTISSIRVYSTFQLEHILPRMKMLAYKKLQEDQMKEWDL